MSKWEMRCPSHQAWGWHGKILARFIVRINNFVYHSKCINPSASIARAWERHRFLQHPSYLNWPRTDDRRWSNRSERFALFFVNERGDWKVWVVTGSSYIGECLVWLYIHYSRREMFTSVLKNVFPFLVMIAYSSSAFYAAITYV